MPWNVPAPGGPTRGPSTAATLDARWATLRRAGRATSCSPTAGRCTSDRSGPTTPMRLVAFHGRLSPESIYFRFFSPKPRLTDKEVERFTTVDMVDRVALVAELGDDLIAVARYDRWPGRDEAEVAFMVDDAHHGRGIATLLLEHLAAVAREQRPAPVHRRGAARQPTMLGVFRRAGFEAARVLGRGDRRRVRHRADPAPTRVGRPARAAAESRVGRAPPAAAVGRGGRRLGPAGLGRPRGVPQPAQPRLPGPVYPVNPTPPTWPASRPTTACSTSPTTSTWPSSPCRADAVLDVVAQCAQKRVRGAIVVSAGFADAGPEGRRPSGPGRAGPRHRHAAHRPGRLGVINTDPAVAAARQLRAAGRAGRAASRCRSSRDRSVPA